MSSKIYLTRERVKEMEEELRHLQTVERRKVAEKIAEARSHGDLSENADYDAAKDEQGLLELRISKISNTLANSEIIDASDFPNDKVYILSKVKVKNIDSGDEMQYTLVSPEEADFEQNKIAVTSPIGKALMGKKLGEIAKFTVPAGTTQLEILDIGK